MFDWIYGSFVNYRFVRALYGMGFVVFWASWAQQSIAAKEATWLVFGWLPAVFWPIQALVEPTIPPVLVNFWFSSVHINWFQRLLGFSFDVQWGAVVIVGVVLLAVGIDLWEALKFWRRNEAEAPAAAE